MVSSHHITKEATKVLKLPLKVLKMSLSNIYIAKNCQMCVLCSELSNVCTFPLIPSRLIANIGLPRTKAPVTGCLPLHFETPMGVTI